ncbi:hypothetical protein WR25_02694 [Diploscapter pachys]|uniref:Uncharacterized protein n=1 Tax=Diploscapter pachys TaxID=2018661 RepID=A0A2A2K1M3_9BILA|nr:hypothetical protein WR25_02694 [Diploscapter pachys]
MPVDMAAGLRDVRRQHTRHSRLRPKLSDKSIRLTVIVTTGIAFKRDDVSHKGSDPRTDLACSRVEAGPPLIAVPCGSHRRAGSSLR